MLLRSFFVVACCSLSACSINSYCLADQDYQRAQIAPEMKSVKGLSLPTTGSALRLPEAPENSEPFGVESEDGTGVCLDKPPRLATPDEKSSKS